MMLAKPAKNGKKTATVTLSLHMGGWGRGVGRRGEPAAAAGGVRGDSPVALGVPSARGRAAGGSRGRPACLDASSCMKIAKKIATVTLSLCMGGEVREG